MNLERTGEIAELYLNKIAELFKPGIQITLVVRTPEHDDRDFIMSSEHLNGPIEALKRRLEE